MNLANILNGLNRICTAEARAKLGFQPRVKLYDGLVQEWEWMKSVGE